VSGASIADCLEMATGTLVAPPRWCSTGFQIQLPCTSDRPQRGMTFCKLLTSVDPSGQYALGFQGKLCKPGTWLNESDLPEHPVVLECAGAVGERHYARRRETVWILWTWNRSLSKWFEIARAPSLNWDWALVLRGPAWGALHPDPGPENPERTAELADQIVNKIDRELQDLQIDVRKSVLSVVRQRLAGEIAA
jgi:hypothetical protein